MSSYYLKACPTYLEDGKAMIPRPLLMLNNKNRIVLWEQVFSFILKKTNVATRLKIKGEEERD